MSNLFHLAQDAAKALTAYERGLAKKKAGHTDVINAIIEYGKALLQGREAHDSDKKFGKWIEDNGLDQTSPFDQRRERSAAQLIATVRNVPDSKIFECPNSRPDDIMKWARKQPWFERTERAPKANKPLKRAKAGRPRKDEPKPISLAPIAMLTGMPKFASEEEKRKWVDPEFVGTSMEWTDKYGHVQVMTAEEYATARFTAWAVHMRALVMTAKQLPELPKVDHNWLRSPKPAAVGKLAEALEYFRPLIAEAEALLERARSAQDLRQRVTESLQSL